MKNATPECTCKCECYDCWPMPDPWYVKLSYLAVMAVAGVLMLPGALLALAWFWMEVL